MPSKHEIDGLPQLRIRSEYSFREAFAPLNAVVERLAEINAPVSALVDSGGTWGHVKWQAAMLDAGLEPAFGVDFKIKIDGKTPRCWCIAEDMRAFYRFCSSSPSKEADFASADGLIRFAGEALTDPQTYDYIDINPRSLLLARRATALAKKTGKPLVLTGDNSYPAQQHHPAFMAYVAEARQSAQHIMHPSEFRNAFFMLDNDTFSAAWKNTIEVGERIKGQRLNIAPVIQFEGDLQQEIAAGKAARLAAGLIPAWTETYEARLQRELDVIREKEFESYFLVVGDLVRWAKQHMLIGPGRGSSAGSLVCYLLHITEVDPIPHGLIFERFIDINRADLPDIDIDFSDQKRHMVFDYLAKKYGAKSVAKIGSINRLKARSVMAVACDRLNIPHGASFSVLDVLVEYSSGDARYGKGLGDTLANTQPGRDFARKFPQSNLLAELEGHANHTSVHAAGILVSDEDITDYCSVVDGIAQLDKVDAEALGLLKIDALGLRTLGVLEDAGCMSNNDFYLLPRDSADVFALFNAKKFAGIFQFEGAAQRRVSAQVDVKNFERIGHITALARPGPLGGGASDSYIHRAAGREEVTYTHSALRDFLAETMGVVLYQEQVMNIVREIGGFSWEDTSIIRKAMSGRKGVEFFDQKGSQFAAGAAKKGVSAEDAEKIWRQICSFGAWGMNKSHTCAYAVISYWCAHLKCHHPLDYAAACLRRAKGDEQVIEILRELRAEGIEHAEFDPQLSAANWSVVGGKLLPGYTSLVGIGPKKAANFIDRRDNGGGLTGKELSILDKCPIKFAELFPAHKLWGDLYANPAKYNIKTKVSQINELLEGDRPAIICRLVRRERRDENEAVRRNRRGSVYGGQSLFLDMFVVDDSVAQPVIARVRPELWHKWGAKLADNAIDGEDWFVLRGRWLGRVSMLIVKKIKCLTNTEIFV